MTLDRWYENAIIYSVDVATFMDGDGDGTGDLVGLTGRLDYLTGLGVTCLWLLPFYPSPRRDNGYDVRDYCDVDPRFGTLDDFDALLRAAHDRGLGVVVDLVVNHTSDQHPWFRAAREDPRSPYRDYYVWVEQKPARTEAEPIFPGEEEDVWTYDERARAYYFHRFYHFEPDLNTANPAVREAIRRVLAFWLDRGVDGFRIDAAPHMIEAKGLPSARPADPHGVLRDLRAFVADRRGDAVLIGEADVEPERLCEFFGDGDELTMLLNFFVDNHLFLALARREAGPLVSALGQIPPIPGDGQWAIFLRNHDELDLERLSDDERREVFAAFAPDESMRIFGRGIRRRLAPMLGGDRRRLELAFSLLLALPGAPVIYYGDEIGMGDDLALDGRTAVHTPMQWSGGPNAGFSTAPPSDLIRAPVGVGPFGCARVNVEAQQGDPHSFLNWLGSAIGARRAAPELAGRHWRTLAADDPGVLALLSGGRDLAVLTVHNLAGRPCAVRLDLEGMVVERELFADRPYPAVGDSARGVELAASGYRWFRLRRVE